MVTPMELLKPIPENMRVMLKEPLPSEAIGQHPTKGYLHTIKAIYVVERLNDVFGLGGWHIKNEIVESEGKMIVVKSIFTAPQFGIYIEAFGGNDNPDRGDAYKGACTDALTKIGSYLYIGMDVYKGLGDSPKPQEPPNMPGATMKQFAAIRSICHSKGFNADEISMNLFNCAIDLLTIKEASELIEHIKQKPEGAMDVQAPPKPTGNARKDWLCKKIRLISDQIEYSATKLTDVIQKRYQKSELEELTVEQLEKVITDFEKLKNLKATAPTA